MSLDGTGEGDGGWSIPDLLAFVRNLKGGPQTADDPIAQYLAARAQDARLPPGGGLFGQGYAAYMADNAPQVTPTSGAPDASSVGDPMQRLAQFAAQVPQTNGDAADPASGAGPTPASTGASRAFGPEASGVDSDQPEIDPALDVEVAGPAKAPVHLNGADAIVAARVADFNKRNQADPGDDDYLDPDWVKAMIRVESGFDRKAYGSDPMQVNKPGDWPKDDDYKAQIGLTKGVAPGQDLGVRAGLDWLESKAYHYDKSGKPTTFLGWPEATRRYNGGGNPHYLQDVEKAYQDIKSGR